MSLAKKLIDGGLFLAHEGGEGAGKTSHALRLQERLTAEGYDVLVTHEPGATKLGRDLRKILLDPDMTKLEIDGYESLLIFSADRHAHIRQIIEPALAAGKIVISDRYIYTTLVYQSYEGVPADIIDAVNFIATGGLLPDRVYWFDANPRIGLERVTSRHASEQSKYDNASLKFHTYVHDEFQKIQAQLPEQIVRIDSNQPIEGVANALYADVSALVSARFAAKPADKAAKL